MGHDSIAGGVVKYQDIYSLVAWFPAQHPIVKLYFREGEYYKSVGPGSYRYYRQAFCALGPSAKSPKRPEAESAVNPQLSRSRAWH